MSAPTEIHPVPPYGLAGAFSGTRWIEGEGRDQCTVVHRPADSQETVTVGVDRRTTVDHGSDAPGTPLPADLARLGMATALVVDLPRVGDDVFEITAEVAGNGDAWRTCKIAVDDRMLTGYEREYEGRWIAYCLTATLVIYVLAPAVLRFDAVELRKLELEGATVLQHGRGRIGRRSLLDDCQG
jgi:hypothetical protein